MEWLWGLLASLGAIGSYRLFAWVVFVSGSMFINLALMNLIGGIAIPLFSIKEVLVQPKRPNILAGVLRGVGIVGIGIGLSWTYSLIKNVNLGQWLVYDFAATISMITLMIFKRRSKNRSHIPWQLDVFFGLSIGGCIIARLLLNETELNPLVLVSASLGGLSYFVFNWGIRMVSGKDQPTHITGLMGNMVAALGFFLISLVRGETIDSFNPVILLGALSFVGIAFFLSYAFRNLIKLKLDHLIIPGVYYGVALMGMALAGQLNPMNITLTFWMILTIIAWTIFHHQDEKNRTRLEVNPT